MKPSQLITIPLLSLSLIISSHAATTFITNTTTPKTLASNESDAFDGLTNGTDANGLHLDAGGDSTVLSLSADDGGGSITFQTVNVSGGANLFMDGDSMGHANDKWGANQNWTFNLDTTIRFDAVTFSVINENMTLRSTAWSGDSDATGSNWSFTTDGTYGIFTILGSNGPGTYDFSSAGVSDVPAGTDIGFGFFASAGGGEQLTSFKITAVPETSAMLLGALGTVLLLRRRR